MKRPSLNFIYRLVWTKKRNLYMPVAENTPSRAGQGFVMGAVLFTLCAGGSSPAFSQEPVPGELPSGGSISAGSGNISSSGSQMTINQSSDRVIINWNTFNIGVDAAVTFEQPDSSSAALNRISDQNPSQIFGKLSANGQIYLANPAGIVFGPSSQVNVGSLVASALDISDEDFMAGDDNFSGDSEGEVVNEGEISTSEDGVVALIGPVVRNEGSIETPSSDSDTDSDTNSDSDTNATTNATPVKEKSGGILLVAGNDVSLDFTGDELIRYQVDGGAVNAQVSNSGRISAHGGLVVMTAQAANNLTSSVVNNTGIIEAQTLQSRGGQIILDAQGGQTTVSGVINVSSANSTGGKIVVTGDRTLIQSTAHLNASGKTGGGEVLVGGSWQGSDPTIHQATGTIVEQGALLEASAIDIGDGGTVVAWSDITNSDSVTRAYGTFEAMGGVNDGDGGRIETSGHWLDTAGVEGSAAAPNGIGGEWLFDPYNVTIADSNANGSLSGANPSIWTPIGNNSTILNTDINNKLDTGTSVTITTVGAGTQLGDILVSSAISKTRGGEATLTLEAANTIDINATISSTTGALNIVLDANKESSTSSPAGIIILRKNITTNGGDLSFGTGRTVNPVLTGGDVYVTSGDSNTMTISTNGGNVDVRGEMILADTDGLTVDSANGDVQFHGVLNSGNASYVFTADQYITWSDAVTAAKGTTGDGSSVNDTYLATITSALENAIAARAGSYQGSWLGAERVQGVGTEWVWRWVTGPEGLEDSGNGLQFFTQISTARYTGGATIDGGYNNWAPNEPNNALLAGVQEPYLQFTGTLGQWNDLKNDPRDSGDSTPWIEGYTTETNLGTSPITITAGSGNVTFSGAVGSSKSLASLAVTTTGTIAINGGGVSTEGLQTYNGDVTLGAASTILTQTAADSDFTVMAGKSISNATNADASLTIKTTGAITMGTSSSISSSIGKLDTVLWSDSDATDGGYIQLGETAPITTNGGHLWLGGGSGTTTWNGLDVGDGYAQGTTAFPVGIYLDSGAINTSGGDIAMYGKSSATGGSSSLPDGTDNATGIYSHNGRLYSINSGTGSIDLNAVSINTSANWYSTALYLNGGSITSSAASGDAITMIGNSATATGQADWRSGIMLIGWDATKSNTISATGGGNIVLTGTGGNGSSQLNPGIRVVGVGAGGSNTITTSGGSGDVTLTGTANDTTSGNVSVRLDSNNDRITSSGDLAITGSGMSMALGSGQLVATGTTSLSASGLDIVANNSANNFGGAVSIVADDVSLRDTNAMVLGTSTLSGDLTVQTGGALTQNGAYTVTGTTSITAGANNVSLDNSSNNFGGAVSVVSAADLTLIDSNAMTLGAISSTGTVDIATLTSNLTVNGAIATSNTTASAITLNAGKNTAAGTAAGGDIIIGGSGSVNTGAGGRTTLYSGSVSNSTGLTALVGSGTGNFRYNSDETITNYTAALGAEKYAIYREQPSVGITATSDTQAYSGVPYSGGNGVSTSGFVNGDTSVLLGGALAYGGTSQGAVNSGAYAITPSGYTNDLGYALAYTDGTLTITGGAAPAPTPIPPTIPDPVQPEVPDSVRPPIQAPLPTVNPILTTPVSLPNPRPLPRTPPEVLPAENPNSLSNGTAPSGIVTVSPEPPVTSIETDTEEIAKNRSQGQAPTPKSDDAELEYTYE